MKFTVEIEHLLADTEALTDEQFGILMRYRLCSVAGITTGYHLSEAPPEIFDDHSSQFLRRNGSLIYCPADEVKAKAAKGYVKYLPEVPPLGMQDEINFSIVWEAYGKKGNRKASFKSFLRTTKEEQAEMIAHIPEYVKSTPDPQYRKNFETYINQKHWENPVFVAAKKDERPALSDPNNYRPV